MKPSELTLRQMAGQRIMAGFSGTGLNPELKYLIDTVCVGGIILFSRNIENRDQLAGLCRDARAYACSCGQPEPIIAVDQEGGSVARLRAPEFFEPPAAAEINGPAQAGEYAAITASELASVRISMNMAPVMDVADPGGKSVMVGRCFGSDPWRVAESGAAVIEGMQKNGVMAVAKHFPGIGRTVTDSHLDLPELDTSFGQLKSRDLVPFNHAILAGSAGIMLSHIRYTALDSRWPASLSTRIAKDLLRGRMGYGGLVITDDLEMGAIANHYTIPEAASRILEAEIDMALICQSPEKAEAALENLLSGLTDPDLLERAAGSVSRILESKNRYPY
ncbi:MAG: beta-N-acetylhexosaminidase [Desulfobacterales bacterium]